MKIPRKAVILAAGLGTRMRPITYSIPKPLLPLWGRPVLRYIMDTLADWGVKEVLINLHHQPDAVFQYLLKEQHPRLKTQFSYEPQILGTGGALQKAAWFLDVPFFWMVNADIVFDTAPEYFYRAIEKHNAISALWLTAESGPRTVAMKKGIISDFRSTQAGAENTYTFCGLQLLSPEILNVLPEGCSSIIDAYEKSISSRKQNIIGVSPENSFWRDIGTPDSYLKVHGEVRDRYMRKLPGGNFYNPDYQNNINLLREKNVSTKGFVFIGSNASVGQSSHIENSVILDRAVLKKGSILTNAILAPGTSVSGNVNGFAMSAVSLHDPNIYRILGKLNWPIADTTVQQFEARGSARSYSRITNGTDTALIVQYSMERPENALFVHHGRFLERNGIRVPSVLLNLSSLNAYVLEDVGTLHLEQVVRQCTKNDIIQIYRKIIDQIILFHSLSSHRSFTNAMPISEPFSSKLYGWERDLFKTFFLLKQRHISHDETNAILSEVETASRHLLNIPHVLIHRDLQSTNIIIHNGEPVFIDFQGMRLGPAQYDLASLLCDPYVSLSQSIQFNILEYYAESTGFTLKQIHNDFWTAAVQRLIQAIGAFGRLSANHETRRFGAYLAPACRMLKRAVKYSGKFSHIEKMCDIFLRKESV